MARTDRCDMCGRSVTITTDRFEYVTGLEGYEYADGTVRCRGNQFGPVGKCMTTDNDGNPVEVGD